MQFMTINTNRVIELALVFFISLFSFSIGTFVGKKYSDNQHRLALLEPNKKTEERKALDEAAGNEAAVQANETEITDADVAKMAEEFSGEDEKLQGESGESEDQGGTTTTTTATPKTEAPAKNVKVIKPEEKDVKEISMEDGEETLADREVASIPTKAKTMSTYTVQVGSYPSEAEATKMTDSLVARGYKANAVAANVNGKTMYRVQVGMFNSFNEAQEYKKELMEKNRLSSAFVQKIAK
jgi:DedD protein